MRRYKKGQFLLVDWLDIVQDSAWTKPNGLTKPPKEANCRTIGFYQGHDEMFLYLSHSIGIHVPDGDKTSIPLGCVQKVRRLDIVQAKKKISPREIKK